MPTASPVATNVAHSISDFRIAVNSSFVPLQITARHPDRFRGVLRAVGVSDVHLTDVRAREHVVERTPELARRGDRPFFKVSMMLAGTGLLIQDGREAVLRPGDLTIYDTSRPYTLTFEEDFRTLVLMFPRHLLSLPPEMVGQLTAVRVPGDRGPGAVTAPYLMQLAANLEAVCGATGVRLTNSAVDLVTTVLSHELGLGGDTVDPHRALMQRIHAYIEHNLASSDLGPASIAAAHYISTRHLHSLFHQQGASVSSWIRTQRLEQCRRDLLDPVLADRPVSAIAARWGFVDAAHFSRLFKSTFDASPSSYRVGH